MQKLRAKDYRHKNILEAPYIPMCNTTFNYFKRDCISTLLPAPQFVPIMFLLHEASHMSVISNFCHPSLRCQTPHFHDQLLQVFLNFCSNWAFLSVCPKWKSK